MMQLLEDIQTVEYIIGYYSEFIAKYQNRRISGNGIILDVIRIGRHLIQYLIKIVLVKILTYAILAYLNIGWCYEKFNISEFRHVKMWKNHKLITTF